ncbi:MAG: MCE family protein [Alphaproteobacteria bacterium]|nr:MCE family protein [Alphaproteobacteria bacterium]
MEEKYSADEEKSIRIGIVSLIAIIIMVFMTISHNASIKKEGDGNTYKVYASFGRTDGLNVGDVVRMSGVSIGRVIASELDADYNSKLTFEIGDEYKIPDDSSASIISFGLIGGKYVEIDVGGSEDFLRSGDSISYTQDALVVEELLDRIISMGKSKNKPIDDDSVINDDKENDIDNIEYENTSLEEKGDSNE